MSKDTDYFPIKIQKYIELNLNHRITYTIKINGKNIILNFYGNEPRRVKSVAFKIVKRTEHGFATSNLPELLSLSHSAYFHFIYVK